MASKEPPGGFMQQLRSVLSKGGSGPSKGATVGVKLLMGAAALGYGLKEATYTVEGGQRAIIFNRIGGMEMDTVLAEGLHFRVPWFQYPIIYDIRARPRKISSLTGSKDLQMVNISLRVLSRPLASNLPHMYQHLGKDYDERVLPSIANEVLKSVVAKFNASQLITQRAQVSLLIRRELLERAKDFSIILDDVSITELSFSREYTAAVESKQVAQQEAQRAQFYVEKAKQDQRQKIIQAEGEAQAAKMLGEAVTKNPGYLKLRKIRAAQTIAKTVATSQNRVYLDANSLVLNLQDTEGFTTYKSLSQPSSALSALTDIIETVTQSVIETEIPTVQPIETQSEIPTQTEMHTQTETETETPTESVITEQPIVVMPTQTERAVEPETVIPIQTVEPIVPVMTTEIVTDTVMPTDSVMTEQPLETQSVIPTQTVEPAKTEIPTESVMTEQPIEPTEPVMTTEKEQVTEIEIHTEIPTESVMTEQPMETIETAMTTAETESVMTMQPFEPVIPTLIEMPTDTQTEIEQPIEAVQKDTLNAEETSQGGQ